MAIPLVELQTYELLVETLSLWPNKLQKVLTRITGGHEDDICYAHLFTLAQRSSVLVT
jgi:hypothetical protein